VRYVTRNSYFVTKEIKRCLVPGEFSRKQLEGHRLAELKIVRPIDLTHTTTPQEPKNAITLPEHRPWQKPAVTALMIPRGSRRGHRRGFIRHLLFHPFAF
jgi:hypothetical protein